MYMKRQILNIINFVRGCEPRCSVDLEEPVRQQIELLDRYGFRGTFLLQYDALIKPEFMALMKSDKNRRNEIGVWLEIVEPMCVKAGIKWRGRFPWDWHADVGFSVGYAPSEREALIDVLFGEFKERFGYYPRVMGSWIIDAHTLAYACDRYGLDASCNCKDQWGTDGYTLWGAYYNGAYFPSRKNVFAPAQTQEDSVGVPVFRMLGSDPVRQYDSGLDIDSGPSKWQGVITLEPVYPEAGGSEKWVDWFFGSIYNGKCLSHAYAQAGQENSFGWDAMKKGLRLQFERFSSLREKGVCIETLGESGRWYSENFRLTPPASVVCDNDSDGGGKKSVWYSCAYYRVNLYCDEYGLRIRDLVLFDPGYSERYLCDVCKSSVLQYDNLSVIDGNRYSGRGIRAGGYFNYCGKNVLVSSLVTEEHGDSLLIKITGDGGVKIRVELRPEGIFAFCDSDGSFSVRVCFDGKKCGNVGVEQNKIFVKNGNFSRTVVTSGPATGEENGFIIDSRDGCVGIFSLPHAAGELQGIQSYRCVGR